jgi:pimeloyl-ACP methyl ester carboxylesterase
MKTQHTPHLAFDDSGTGGPLVVMLPGAGDLRSEYRFVVDHLIEAGFRVVAADLPGHGDSPTADEYTVSSTATAIVELVSALDGGPATIVATSFAPAAAVWAATDRPDLIGGVVAISPHFTSDESTKGRLQATTLRLAMAGPWAGALWAMFYRSWYKTNRPADLDHEISRMKTMLADPARRRAVKETLTADRVGVEQRMGSMPVPTLSIFGTADDHFDDPAAEAAATSSRLGGTSLMIDGAGHYPHVEFPETAAKAIIGFVNH